MVRKGREVRKKRDERGGRERGEMRKKKIKR